MKRSLFSELKRRNVPHAAAFYIAATWALAEGIAQLGPAVGAPESHDPLNPKIHGSLAYDYSRLGRIDEAIAGYRTALSLRVVVVIDGIASLLT